MNVLDFGMFILFVFLFRIEYFVMYEYNVLLVELFVRLFGFVLGVFMGFFGFFIVFIVFMLFFVFGFGFVLFCMGVLNLFDLCGVDLVGECVVLLLKLYKGVSVDVFEEMVKFEGVDMFFIDVVLE